MVSAKGQCEYAAFIEQEIAQSTSIVKVADD
jgi:hypothetical protein